MTHLRTTRLLRRIAAPLCAALISFSIAGPLRAQSPVPDPSPSPAVPTVYSSPLFHAGGALTPPPFESPLPVPFPDPLYEQLQGTPTGLVPGTVANAGTTVSTEIPSFLLGNYLPTLPPAAPGIYFPNHFRDGTIFSWSAPLTFLTPNEPVPTTLGTGTATVPNVEGTPTAVNLTEYPFIKNMQYIGTAVGTASTPDTNSFPGSTIPGLHSGSAPIIPPSATATSAGDAYLIRQVVYFGRVENLTTTAGGATTTVPVGAIYCVDGFTGEVIWRYQTSQVSDGSVFSAPAVAYINVLTNAGAAVPVYANKAVVVVGDNNGFVYCLDAAGNGDGTSNSNATTGVAGQPIYGAQPTYGTTVSTTTGSHVGTTSAYWIYRPDPNHPTTAAGATTSVDPNSNLPVPGPFGIASPNIYVERGISTTPAADGTLESNSIIYLGNTRDCVYALDGLGVANNLSVAAGTLPAYNTSLPAATTGIPDAVPTCNPRWWFTPDQGNNLGISFESTPALSPPSGPYPTGTIITSSADPVASGTSVTFTATVVDGSGSGGVPTGSVTFSVDGVAQPTPTPLVGGSATFTPAAPLTPGAHSITAAYSGDGNFVASTNTPAFDEEVDSGTVGTSNVVVMSSFNPSPLGGTVTFTATVTDGSGLAGVPTGTVTFTVGSVAQAPVPVVAGVATSAPIALTTAGPVPVMAAYNGDPIFSASSTSFQEYVLGQLGPTVYIGSSQELGTDSNAGRLYALDGLTGPTTTATATGSGRNLAQRAKWAFPNLYASGSGNVGGLPVRPALGGITGSPVVFTNTDDIIPAVGTVGVAGYVPAHPRTRIYFAADSGLEVPTGGNTPNPRPATDATGRVWAVNLDGTTATTATTLGGTTTTVWSFPQANDPNNVGLDRTPEPSPAMGAFLDSTPAMGFVQFPTVIQYGPSPYTSYTHTDPVNTTAAGGVLGKSVPMLYIGTNGSADLGFYALDVDGSNDTERGVYRIESPSGAPFQSSPVLVTNSSTTGGNGGAVYATSGNDLLQLTATPISNVNAALTSAFVGVDAEFSGGGPISGPAVASADVSDLATGTTTSIDPVSGLPVSAYTYFGLYGGKNTTDFVYFGDGVLGFCRGITPVDPNYGGAVPPTFYGGVTDTNPPSQFSNKFFLQAYLFDGGTTASATDTNMNDALGLNNSITGFEWGGFVYVRIGNVVPPCPAADVASPTAAELVADPTDPTLFYGNGQAVTFSVGSSTVSVPTTLLTSLAGTNLTVNPSANGFIQRSDMPATPNTTQLVSASNSLGWLAAYSYPIGSAQTRIGDTPGAYRRISQANQTATVYTLNADGTYTQSGTISLTIQTSLGSQYATGNPPTAIAQTPPQEQPTFGILNPLAVQGLGKTLPISSPAAPATVADEAGPSLPLSTMSLTPAQKLAAYTNGSNTLKGLPHSGYDPTAENPTNATQFIQDQTAYAAVPITVATSVGDIPDGSSGDNNTSSISTPPVYGLQVENRSLIGIYDHTLFPALAIGMQPVKAHWNDNTVDSSGNTQNGPGATINPLPWEDLDALSSITTNASQDYPDIPASDITHTLYSGSQATDLNSNNPNALLDFTTGSAGSPSYTADHVQVTVSVPPHQPANLQVWDGSAKAPTYPGIMTVGDNIFPQGYIEGSGSGAGINVGGGTPLHVYVAVGARGRFSTRLPYRDVQSFVGVPVDMKTTIQDGTVSLGKGPSSLGIQTEQYTPLGLFSPYNPAYRTFFRPVTVYNVGNTNLLNVQFNQQLTLGGSPLTLSAQSDGNDPLSALGAFDYLAASGPQTTVSAGPPPVSERTTYAGAAIPLTGTSIPEQPFLFRTSLDTDLMLAYGKNPHVQSNTGPLYSYSGTTIPVNTLYAGATFHKPRVGVPSTTLTVPDVPDTGGSSYSLPATTMPTLNSSGPLVTTTAPPYVGISVPFGTPVGTYATADAQPLRVFEGEDSSTHSTQATPYYLPQYGGVDGGHASPTKALVTQLPLDTTTGLPTLPVSDPGVKLNISVLEDRMTDGFTFGATPMLDNAAAGPNNGAGNPISTPDFAPAAFRNPATGNLSVYWTSGRSGSFGIYGANVPFNLSGSAAGSYFYTANPSGQWWTSVGGYTAATPPALKPVLPISAGSPIYSGLNLAQDPNNTAHVSAFVVSVNAAAPYGNTLYSYPITPAHGAGSTFAADALGTQEPITPASDSTDVKYGVKGLYTSFTNPLWAFWTASTRGRTEIYYNSQSANGGWQTAISPLPIPAGLTAVADANPLLMPSPISAIEVTYSGTAPDGNVDLYVSRYAPSGTSGAAASQLSLVQFPAVTENLRAVGGWYQARDVAWSRTGALNVFVNVNGTQMPLVYTTPASPATPVPLFTKAIYDKASGLLVLTGVQVPQFAPGATLKPTTNTLYVDGATGRIRFSPALLPATQNFAPLRATFSPLARRLTEDSRADTAPVTFMDTAQKPNDAALVTGSLQTGSVEADRRWTVWRKSGVSGVPGSATLYFKTQRLTFFLPPAIDPTKAVTITLNGSSYTNSVDVDYERGRLYFPVASGAEGETAVVSYTNSSGVSVTTPLDPNNTVQWQDEPLANNNDVPPADSAAGLDTIIDNGVSLDTAVNENNVAAFLDPFASATSSHKVWLFWNSTRNGTADIYSETIDPRFAPGP